jgi:hypothetical protein
MLLALASLPVANRLPEPAHRLGWRFPYALSLAPPKNAPVAVAAQ